MIDFLLLLTLSEGYCSWVCMSVKSHLTYGASVRPENAVMYSEGHEDQKTCGIFSEIAPLHRYSTPSVHRHTYSRPFCFMARVCILCLSVFMAKVGGIAVQTEHTQRWVNSTSRSCPYTNPDKFENEINRCEKLRIECFSSTLGAG